jgi:hypothetical protein
VDPHIIQRFIHFLLAKNKSVFDLWFQHSALAKSVMAHLLVRGSRQTNAEFPAPQKNAVKSPILKVTAIHKKSTGFPRRLFP